MFPSGESSAWCWIDRWLISSQRLSKCRLLGPNSWAGALGGPRETPETGFRSFSAEEKCRKVPERTESFFADPYSQARQFDVRRPKGEEGHIAGPLTLELRKVFKNPQCAGDLFRNCRTSLRKLADRI